MTLRCDLGRLLPLPAAAAELFGGTVDEDGVVKASESCNMRLRRMVAADEIRHVRVGRRIYIPRSVIDDLTC